MSAVTESTSSLLIKSDHHPLTDSFTCLFLRQALLDKMAKAFSHISFRDMPFYQRSSSNTSAKGYLCSPLCAIPFSTTNTSVIFLWYAMPNDVIAGL